MWLAVIIKLYQDVHISLESGDMLCIQTKRKIHWKMTKSIDEGLAAHCCEDENQWMDVPLIEFIVECCGNRLRYAFQNAIVNQLYPSGYTVRDLLQSGKSGLNKLKRIPNIGRKSIAELSLALEVQGISNFTNDTIGECLIESVPDAHLSVASPFIITPELIDEIIERLEVRRKRIVLQRFGLGDDGVKTCQEIGDELSLSRERVRQLEKSTIRRLKGGLSALTNKRRLDASQVPDKYIPLLKLIGNIGQAHRAIERKSVISGAIHNFATFSEASAFAKLSAKQYRINIRIERSGDGGYMVQFPKLE
ncbi:MAG: hypothetical protein FP821_02300 [Sideroxydans sp.]|nr:hypothetical protein [Sideroxydans sp.]